MRAKGFLVTARAAICVVGIALLSLQPAAAGDLSPEAKKAFDAGYRLSQQGEIGFAALQYRRAVELAPDSWDVWLECTSILRRSHRYQSAARAGWHTVALKDDPRSWGNLGNVFAETGAFDAATAAYEKAAAAAGANSTLDNDLTNLAWQQGARGDWAGAVKTLDRALAVNPTSAKALVDKGIALASLGQAEDAKKLIQSGVEAAAASRNSRVETYGKMALETIARGGRIPPPPRALAAPLPDRFLRQPEPGKAFALPVDPTITHRLPFGDRIFSIPTPESWTAQYEQEGVVPTVIFVPDSGPGMRLHVSPLPVSMTLEQLKTAVSRDLDQIRGGAAEKDIPLREIVPDKSIGYWFFVTDASVDPARATMENMPYLAQGHILVGTTPVLFSLFSMSNDQGQIMTWLAPIATCRIE